MKRDYLWDGKNPAGVSDTGVAPGAAADVAEVERLERLLGRFRAPDAETLQFPQSAWEEHARRIAQNSAWREWLAVAAVLMLVIGGVWCSIGTPRPAVGDWQVARIEGNPRVGYKPVGDIFRLRAGEVLETDEASSARIDVGNIGEVKVGPESRVRLLEAQATSGSIGLEQGTIEALIWAPPMRFVVQTQSATAVDLGCEYTIHIGADGDGWMRVSIGWVAFQKDGRESFVPVNAMVLIRKDVGPGTPFYEDASEKFRAALEEIDFGNTAAVDSNGRSAALTTLLEQSRARDAITLWHLLARTEGAELAQAYDRLAKLAPPPNGVTRAGILKGDPHMRDLWWNALGLRDTDWWRDWKREFPGR